MNGTRRLAGIDRVAIAGAVLGLLGLHGPVSAQQLPRIGEPVPARVGVGYIVNAPSQLLGGAMWGTVPALGGIGLYVDAKFDASSPGDESNYIADITAQEVDDQLGDQFVESSDSWWTVNVAVVKPLTRQLAVYAGAGMSDRTGYRQYYDPDRELGRVGYYWVENPEISQSQVNFLAGAIFTLTGYLNFHFGGETTPGGFTVGMSLSLPKMDLSN